MIVAPVLDGTPTMTARRAALFWLDQQNRRGIQTLTGCAPGIDKNLHHFIHGQIVRPLPSV
jgi:hypothetical protein